MFPHEPEALSEDHGISGGAHPNPPDGQPQHALHDQDVVLAVLGQVLEPPDVSNAGLPARAGDVLHLDTLELLDAGGIALHPDPVLHIAHPDLDLVHLVEDIELGHGEGCVPVHHGGVLHSGQVKPATSPGPARGHAKLVTLFPEKLA